MKNNESYHIPVMLPECIDALDINPSGIYVDVTFGGGSHSRAIFEQLGPEGKLISFDQDQDAKKNAWNAPNFDFVAANFAYISNHLRLLGIQKVDGILADLGVSSHQFDEADRGFSIRGEAALDMRMNQHGDLSAEDIVNNYTEEELLRIFRNYGEISHARKLVNTIESARSNKRIKTTGELLQIVEKCAPRNKEHKYFAQVFQAIRIETNDEMKVLEDFLLQCEDVIKPGGRLVVMSYHSLEDRLVKNYMKRGSLDGKIEKDFFGNVLKPFTEIVRHPITANEEELERNNRARSAKLRIAERDGE
ncbi:MAG: 16S rRNA (cytosine(1402)-N(4))-methyltransferase RsmH [Crocinitomicaceae bacterium]|nr:16S rRNA (cytosine(1402)-N(4))-methyltransferase RsmH [Crocinitomicaceae bacterium]